MDRLAEFKTLKHEYDEIEIPAGLDFAINTGIELGKKKIQKDQNRKRVLNACASIAVALAVFTTAVNVSPSFADMIDDIPVLGELVKILKFVDGEASGGEITDGVDISDIAVIEDTDSGKIVLNFESASIPKDDMGFYNIVYSENPSVMTLEIYGARMISASDDFENIMKSDYVKDIYTLMTLDDSLIRLNIVFKENVSYSVQELKNPASLVIELSEGEKSQSEEMYSVRTYSYPRGEGFGILEEEIMPYDELSEYRILKDNEGGFLIEFGIFDTADQAEDLKVKVEELTGMKVLVENREPNSVINHIEE